MRAFMMVSIAQYTRLQNQDNLRMEVLMRSCFILLFLLLLTAIPVSASDVGSVKNLEGQAWIVRGEEQIPAKEGDRLLVLDILKTGVDGAMGIILRDDTIISMGPSSQMVLSEFVFQPKQKQMGMLTNFLKGTFTYISGEMAKLDPSSVKVETPEGMVAIRGTHFLIKVE
jgi:hypothetical protein